jgi:glutamate synthase domain-containing protein 3
MIDMMNVESTTLQIDAMGLHYRQLNTRLRQAVNQDGITAIAIHNVYGQRYLGTDLHRPVEIHIHGTPGNDLASFMDGPRIVVHGNAQDGCGNTMNEGEVIIHGRAGDVTGHSMRGGKIWVRDDVGYRVGIHMKAYQDKRPIIIIGGTAQHFLGEYMAGGVLMVLGLTLAPNELHAASYIGTGMHGGAMYIRGEIADHQLGKGVGRVPLDATDEQLIKELVDGYAAHFGHDSAKILATPFMKLVPLSLRPYGRLYAY